MDQQNWKEFLQKAKADYYKIGAISCPAFGGELVYFNKHGWNHFLFKDRMPRNIAQQVRRMQLLKYAPQIISIVRSLADHTETTIGNSHAHFWAAHQKIDEIRLRVVIRQCNNGRKCFLSIMEER